MLEPSLRTDSDTSSKVPDCRKVPNRGDNFKKNIVSIKQHPGTMDKRSIYGFTS